MTVVDEKGKRITLNAQPEMRYMIVVHAVDASDVPVVRKIPVFQVHSDCS